MGKLGRFACIFVPMALSIASLISLIFVEVGNTSTSSPQSTLFFFKADTSDFKDNPNLISGTNLDNGLLNALQTSVKTGDLKDFYQVGLWNYCSGNSNNGQDTVTFCSKPQRNFYFNFKQVWNLHGQAVNNNDDLNNALSVYQKVSSWMFTAYAIAFFATIAEIVVGFFAVCSRWGSFVTTIVSGISSAFTLAASATATATFAGLAGTFDSALKPYNISASLGSRMLAATWLATAFSLGAGFFWLISVCCCSGKSSSPAHRHRGVMAEKTPYTYERVHSPFAPNGRAPAPQGTHYAGPYEPYRAHV